MGNDTTQVEVVQDESTLTVPERSGLVAAGNPQDILKEARLRASALGDVLKGKKKPVVFRGEQYLEFEDWQTLGNFYGITSKVESTQFVEYGSASGFEAVAVALQIDTEKIVSRAEHMCLNDESNWIKKPLAEIRSMAQTRACAKALRNVLAWVVVLAGYKPTPAEEMPQEERSNSDRKATANQVKKFWSMCHERADATGSVKEEIGRAVFTAFGIKHSSEIKQSQLDALYATVEKYEPGPITDEDPHNSELQGGSDGTPF